jgi:hypothetical protein
MGIESFFIIIMPKNVTRSKDELGFDIYKGNSDITYRDLKLLLDSIENLTYLNTSELACHVMKKYLLTPYFENNKLMSISLEACLWYLIYDNDEIANLLSFFYQKGCNIFHPGIGLLNSSMNDFLNNLRKFYNQKSKAFITKYGRYFENEKILPSSYFYERIYKVNSSWLKRLFHFIFS